MILTLQKITLMNLLTFKYIETINNKIFSIFSISQHLNSYRSENAHTDTPRHTVKNSIDVIYIEVKLYS